MKSKFVYAAVVFCMIFALVPALMPASSIQAVVPGTTWTVDDLLDELPTANFTSIQEAIDNASVHNGDTILVYDGTYTENLNVWKSLNIMPFNDHEEAPVVIDGGGKEYAVYINASNVYFGATYEGFIITNADYGIGVYPPNSISFITGVSIINNNISACTRYGIYVDPTMPSESVYGITVSGNEISGCPIGIEFVNYGSGDFYNNAVTYNTIYSCSNLGIDVYNNGEGDIRNNNISCNTIYDAGTGIYFDNEYNGSMSDNTVSGNTIYTCIYDGIEFYNYDNTGNMDDNTISTNTIYDCSHYGIKLDNSGSDGNMNGNTIQDNNVSDCDQVGDAGILISSSGTENSSVSHNTVQGNTVARCSNNGILLNNNADGNMDDNTISGNTVYGSSEGIYLVNYGDGNMDGNTLDDDTVYDCDYGIYLVSTGNGDMDDNIIEDNSVSDCVYDGIWLDMTGEASMSGNTIQDNDVYDCDKRDDDAGIQISSTGGASSSVNSNTIQGNTVVNSSNIGILLYSRSDGNMSGNTISGNTLYNNFGVPSGTTGILLITENYGANIENSTIENNTAYGFYDGIYLDDMSTTSIHNINISNNHLWNGLPEAGIGNNCSIYVFAAHDISIAGNDISYSTDAGIYDRYGENINITANDIHHNYGDGIHIYDTDYINISTNTIHHNGYNDGAGIDIDNSNNIDIWSNDIHANPEGIYILNSDEIDIYSNDIRDNIGSGYTGIYVDDGAEDVYIYCNNIVSNDEGVYSDSNYYVYAYDNWWGAADGPSGSGPGNGDSVSWGSYAVDYTPWLEKEISFGDVSDMIVNTASVPGTISVYDALWGDEDCGYAKVSLTTEEESTPTPTPDYTLGPAYADLIVEVNSAAYNPTSGITGLALARQFEIEQDGCTPTATVNISALLLAMLPADFQEAYVSHWDEYLQEDWQRWLDDLSRQDMYFYAEDGLYFYDYELCLYALISSNDRTLCGSCYNSLSDFFYEAYENEANGYSGYEKLYDLILKELRLGDFQIPATITSCTGDSYTTTIPLTIVDFQLPLEVGWNLRSTPITLDSGSATWGAIKSMGDGLPDFEAALVWNAASNRWEELTSGTAITPLNAYYIKMSGRDQLGFIVNREVSGPPQRPLYSGWNLVSSATSWTAVNWSADLPSTYPFPLMLVQDALITTEVGNITGWSIAIGMPEMTAYEEAFYYKGLELKKPFYYKYFVQAPWTVVNSGNWSGAETEYAGVVTPGGGYWVFMENPDTLAGFSFTPLFWNYLR